LIGFRALAAAGTMVLSVLISGSSGTKTRSTPSARSHFVVETAPASVRRLGVFEATFSARGAGYSNPWEQVRLTMTLISPTGRRIGIGGFYDGGNTWKARFAPARRGRWRWTSTVRDGMNRQRFHGAFRVVHGPGHGFVRRSPYNRFRWIFSDGTPYYPVGIGDCVVGSHSSSSPFEDWGLDGGRTDFNTYLRAYQRAGVNLFRWSVDNCAFGLFRTIAPGGNVYLAQQGAWGDEVVRGLRRHGFRVYMTIFGDDPDPPFTDDPSGAQLQAVERYVKYVVDRYGAYVDYWELMNEANASVDWYTQVARYLRSVDPYHHPISTSWERPQLPVIDINSPHWYQTESQFESDRITWDRFREWKGPGKPVIVGEQGNAGQNWDPLSGLRMRLRAWTAFFAEGTLVFWNTSHSKDYHAPAGNIYLGPEERKYLRVLQGFTRNFDRRARIVSAPVSPGDGIRGYALRGPAQYAAYLHAYTDHVSPTAGLSLKVDIPRRGKATWISPATGRVLGREALRHRGMQTLRVPPFVTDVAVKLDYRLRR
jgi:hypothetical protein